MLQKERKQKLIPRLRKQKKSKRSLNRIKWSKAIKEMVLTERAWSINLRKQVKQNADFSHSAKIKRLVVNFSIQQIK